MIEIELRYKVADPENTLALLRRHNIEVSDDQRIIDKWFVPNAIHSRVEHDEWFDVEHGIAYRIRHIQSKGKAPRLVLDSKQHTNANNHNTFDETVLIYDDEPAMLSLMEAKGYYNWLTIDKRRQIFSSNQQELSISMDTINGIKDQLGIDTVLEIEYTGESTREDALTAINAFASSQRLNPNNLFEKSLTVEAMRVLAKFR